MPLVACACLALDVDPRARANRRRGPTARGPATSASKPMSSVHRLLSSLSVTSRHARTHARTHARSNKSLPRPWLPSVSLDRPLLRCWPRSSVCWRPPVPCRWRPRRRCRWSAAAPHATTSAPRSRRERTPPGRAAPNTASGVCARLARASISRTAAPRHHGSARACVPTRRPVAWMMMPCMASPNRWTRK